MMSTCAVLFLFAAGVLSAEHETIGRIPHRNNPRPSLNIFNGNKTSVSKYPFIASLVQNREEYGAAVILNRRWLLTTAYAVAWVPSSALGFRVGSNYYDSEGQVFGAAKVVQHPNYNGTWDWNIAVVKTNKPIKFGKNIKPIKLGTKKLEGGTIASVAGWGVYDSAEAPSANLLDAQVTVYDWKKCEETYKSDLSDRIMCSFDQTVAPCIYDFGDLLVVNNMVYGLFAGGYNCVPGVNPVLYTDVPSLYKWVQSAIKNDKDEQE